MSLLSTPFHHTKLIQGVTIFPDGIVQNLNRLAHNQAQFGSLRCIVTGTDGRVFISQAPDRQPWTQLAVSLKENWASLPPEVWRAAKLLNLKNCEVHALVSCLYYPYMMGKRRDWHEKGGSWCSSVSSYSEGTKSWFADIILLYFSG